MAERRLYECPKCGKLSCTDGVPLHSHDGENVACVLRTAPLPSESLDALQAEIDEVDPLLRKANWPPMTYMLIPSVLESADLLLLRLDASAGADPSRAAALRDRLVGLRTAFERK